MVKVPFRGGGSGGRGSGKRGRVTPTTLGSGSRMPSGSGTIPASYQLRDTPETPESADSVGTSFPTITPGVGTSVTSSVALSTALAAEAAAAEARATEARANATAAAEIAAAAVAAVAAAAAAQAVVAAAQADAAAAQAIENENVNDEFPNAHKILLGVDPGRIPRFQPSTASMMNKIFKLRVDVEGSNWTRVTPEMKDFYWEEFKKHFIWPRGAESSVKHCWNKAAGKRYRDFINDRKSDLKKRDYIPDAVWSRWKADWNTPEALELSRKKREARMGGANGLCSKHTGGSITTSEHAIRFEVKNKRKPTCNELFELTHRRKYKSFVDEKSASVDAAFKARKLELSQQCDDPALMLDDDAIFLEVVGGLNKEGSVYGLGSQCSSFIESSSSGASSSTLSQQISISMLHDFIERALADFGLHNEENIGRRIGKEVESRMSRYEITLLEMQNLLTALTVNLQVEGSI